MKQAARGIGLSMSSYKTEFMGFKLDGAISILNDNPLKLVDYFTYLDSNILSPESYVNMSTHELLSVGY